MPGGWGTPNITEVAMNSPQSQKEVVGAIVKQYIINGIINDKKVKILFIFLYIILFYYKVNLS